MNQQLLAMLSSLIIYVRMYLFDRGMKSPISLFLDLVKRKERNQRKRHF